MNLETSIADMGRGPWCIVRYHKGAFLGPVSDMSSSGLLGFPDGHIGIVPFFISREVAFVRMAREVPGTLKSLVDIVVPVSRLHFSAVEGGDTSDDARRVVYDGGDYDEAFARRREAFARRREVEQNHPLEEPIRGCTRVIIECRPLPDGKILFRDYCKNDLSTIRMKWP